MLPLIVSKSNFVSLCNRCENVFTVKSFFTRVIFNDVVASIYPDGGLNKSSVTNASLWYHMRSEQLNVAYGHYVKKIFLDNFLKKNCFYVYIFLRIGERNCQLNLKQYLSRIQLREIESHRILKQIHQLAIRLNLQIYMSIFAANMRAARSFNLIYFQVISTGTQSALRSANRNFSYYHYAILNSISNFHSSPEIGMRI